MSDYERQAKRTDLVGACFDRDTWLTPPALLKSLGHFDLDPCAAVGQPWTTADKQYTILNNGLKQPWTGRVWMNPPYGGQVERWMERLADHGDGIALVFARTETGAFHPWVWDHAHSVFFFNGRLRFCTIDGRAGKPATAPSVLVAFGGGATDAIAAAGLAGRLLRL